MKKEDIVGTDINTEGVDLFNSIRETPMQVGARKIVTTTTKEVTSFFYLLVITPVLLPLFAFELGLLFLDTVVHKASDVVQVVIESIVDGARSVGETTAPVMTTELTTEEEDSTEEFLFKVMGSNE